MQMVGPPRGRSEEPHTLLHSLKASETGLSRGSPVWALPVAHSQVLLHKPGPPPGRMFLIFLCCCGPSPGPSADTGGHISWGDECPG